MYPPIKGLSLALAFLNSCHASLLPRGLSNVNLQNATDTNNPLSSNTTSQAATTTPQTTNGSYVPDHPQWAYLNGIEWWKSDPTQLDHARFHAYLSMAAYGNYESTCPTTFTQGFTVLEKFNTDIGQAGFVALIPEMQKVVIVFKGDDNIESLDWTPESINDLVPDCPGCTAAKGIKALYMSARQKTNNWAIAKAKVKETGLKFSVTGHAIGGAVAAVAALDLGTTNWVHYSHNQAMPRALNYDSVVKYDNLYQVLAGQSLIAENDYMVQSISPNLFFHVGSRVKILGPMQQYLVNCYGNNENSTCNGDGSNYEIHNNYFTPRGSCGSANKGW